MGTAGKYESDRGDDFAGLDDADYLSGSLLCWRIASPDGKKCFPEEFTVNTGIITLYSIHPDFSLKSTN